jgi:signal peptide peptidase SppA
MSEAETPQTTTADPQVPDPAAHDEAPQHRIDLFIPTVSPLRGLSAHIDQYFGVWCVLPERFMAMAQQVQPAELVHHIEITQRGGSSTVSSDREYEMLSGGIALIEISGTLMKYGSSLNESSSTIGIRRKIRLAAKDAEVNSILLRIDSPGGSSAGTQDLADDIAAAARQKPLVAYIEDLGASAAYWIASQCPKVYANRSAMVGSIGTYAVVQDVSGAAAAMGVRVHVVRAGDFKGAGTPGTQVTPDQLAEWQRIVDETNEFFLRGVASGRGKSVAEVRKLADGRVHIGAAAKTLGLIDGVQSFDETILQLQKKGKKPMSETSTKTTAAAPATIKELRAALVGADAEFLTSQLDAEATIEQAKEAWMKHLASENATLRAKAKDTKPSDEEDEEDEEDPAAKGKGKEGGKPCKSQRHGVEPIGNRSGRTTSAYEGNPLQDFSAAVRETMKLQPHLTRSDAVRLTARQDPALHEAYLRATPQNKGQRVQSLIDDLVSVAR